MELTRFSTLKPPPHRSDAVATGETIFVSGMIASAAGTIEEQTRDVLAKIDAVLEAAGTDRGKVIWASVWLTDLSEFHAFNELWMAWIEPGREPARACVGAQLVAPGRKVEIAVVAAR